MLLSFLLFTFILVQRLLNLGLYLCCELAHDGPQAGEQQRNAGKVLILSQLYHRLLKVADSAQTEYCPTFHCPCVRHSRDISHFSNI